MFLYWSVPSVKLSLFNCLDLSLSLSLLFSRSVLSSKTFPFYNFTYWYFLFPCWPTNSWRRKQKFPLFRVKSALRSTILDHKSSAEQDELFDHKAKLISWPEPCSQLFQNFDFPSKNSWALQNQMPLKRLWNSRPFLLQYMTETRTC